MSTAHVSYPCPAKNSIAEEFGRPGNWKSKVGCDAMEDPWTNRMIPFAAAGSTAHLFHINRFTSPLRAQCSVPGFWWIIAFMHVFPGGVAVSWAGPAN